MRAFTTISATITLALALTVLPAFAEDPPMDTDTDTTDTTEDTDTTDTDDEYTIEDLIAEIEAWEQECYDDCAEEVYGSIDEACEERDDDVQDAAEEVEDEAYVAVPAGLCIATPFLWVNSLRDFFNDVADAEEDLGDEIDDISDAYDECIDACDAAPFPIN